MAIALACGNDRHGGISGELDGVRGRQHGGQMAYGSIQQRGRQACMEEREGRKEEEEEEGSGKPVPASPKWRAAASSATTFST